MIRNSQTPHFWNCLEKFLRCVVASCCFSQPVFKVLLMGFTAQCSVDRCRAAVAEGSFQGEMVSLLPYIQEYVDRG